MQQSSVHHKEEYKEHSITILRTVTYTKYLGTKLPTVFFVVKINETDVTMAVTRTSRDPSIEAWIERAKEIIDLDDQNQAIALHEN